MGLKQAIQILILLIFLGCGTNNPAERQTMGQSKSEALKPSNAQLRTYKSNLSKEELIATDRKLSSKVRDNFRSWSLLEPERWEYLAGKFADEIILSSPESAPKRQEIADAFLIHIKQRANIMNSDLKDKQIMMKQSIPELNNNLILIIGIEEFNKWAEQSKIELHQYRLKKDSLVKSNQKLKNLN